MAASRCHPGPVTCPTIFAAPRRPLFGPVVIAAVFLAIIGSRRGLVLGSQRRSDGGVRATASTSRRRRPAADPDAPCAPAGSRPRRAPTGRSHGRGDRHAQVPEQTGGGRHDADVKLLHPDRPVRGLDLRDDGGQLFYQGQPALGRAGRGRAASDTRCSCRTVQRTTAACYAATTNGDTTVLRRRPERLRHRDATATTSRPRAGGGSYATRRGVIWAERGGRLEGLPGGRPLYSARITPSIIGGRAAPWPSSSTCWKRRARRTATRSCSTT